MILSDEQVQKILEESMETIKASIIEEATRQVTFKTEYAVAARVQDVVSDYIKEEIAPAIKEALAANKDTIVQAAVVAATDMSEKLTKALISAMTTNLADKYHRGKVMEALFG
jgi:class 3 adenylate cyclase